MPRLYLPNCIAALSSLRRSPFKGGGAGAINAFTGGYDWSGLVSREATRALALECPSAAELLPDPQFTLHDVQPALVRGVACACLQVAHLAPVGYVGR